LQVGRTVTVMVAILFASLSILVFRFRSRAAPRSSLSLSLFSISWPFCADGPRPTSAFIPGSAFMGAALPDLASGHRRNGPGQARNRGRVASPRLPVLSALAITASGTARGADHLPTRKATGIFMSETEHRKPRKSPTIIGLTILFVIHDLDEALYVAQRIVMLRASRDRLGHRRFRRHRVGGNPQGRLLVMGTICARFRSNGALNSFIGSPVHASIGCPRGGFFGSAFANSN
jgi:hypothetical protein